MEFIGLARTLRNKVVKARAVGAGDRLIKPFQPRPEFTPFPSHRLLYRLARDWDRLPTVGRLSSIASLREGRLQLAELRVIPARIRFEGWDDDELALSLRSIAAICAPPAFTASRTLIADVGLHALARRFERGADRSEEAVLHDLAPLAREHRGIAEHGGEFAIPATSGGRWIGSVTIVKGARVLAVRTFIAASQ
jgi:hypothetical protein